MPKRHIAEELGDDSVDDRRRDKKNEERSEHSVLHVADRVTKHVECETVKDTDDDGDEQLSVEIRRIAPVLRKQSLREHSGLQPDRGRKLCGFVVRLGTLLTAFGLYATNLFYDLCVVAGFSPLVVPIDAAAIFALCRFLKAKSTKVIQ